MRSTATTARFVWGTPFVKKVTWTKGLDAETGMPLEYDPKKDIQPYLGKPDRTNLVAMICPGNMGGKNWPPTAYHPDLKIWYIPVIESCNQMTKVQPMIPGESYKPREFFTGGGPSQPERITGSVTAIDVTTGKIVGQARDQVPAAWRHAGHARPRVHRPSVGRACGATTRRRWSSSGSSSTGSGINAPPMTFTVDGKQYIALLVGLGGAWPKWFVDGTPELKSMQPGSVLYVFSL